MAMVTKLYYLQIEGENGGCLTLSPASWDIYPRAEALAQGLVERRAEPSESGRTPLSPGFHKFLIVRTTDREKFAIPRNLSDLFSVGHDEDFELFIVTSRFTVRLNDEEIKIAMIDGQLCFAAPKSSNAERRRALLRDFVPLSEKETEVAA